MRDRAMIVLGLEASCDETAAAVVSGTGEGPGVIHANAIFGQEDLHAGFGGVVPEIAARAHAERADRVVMRALDEAAMTLGDIDAISVTAGPGLIGGVLAGVMTARGIAAGSGLPLIGVNHLEGHALTPRLTDGIAYPYLLLLVSGGHCQLIAVEALGRYRRLGGTIDDAPGEAFDKTARLLGLGFPGGPEVEAAALAGDAGRFDFPKPLLDRDGCDMSFSGLKTAVARARDALIAKQGGLYRQDLADLSVGFQNAVRDVLGVKAARAMALFRDRHPGLADPVIAVAGGVAANKALRGELERRARDAGFRLVAPPLKLCTDNGAMIAWAGLERLAAGITPGEATPRPRWPLDETAEPLLGSGKKGAKA
ncbi:tRNA (adenosine(37)-N6)-threonylcarbamoyltransferase complex transferase subunit TsaD [Rhodobacteraceae bacterium NNCM2]|nr:tRNA (adenosine(37)-N6)-threonylcarbamoyltransferase complex transferase subunit TsaD [Coraliihabitans acroporae]